MLVAPRMRKVVLTDSAGGILTRFELPETSSVADVAKLFAKENPHFSDEGFLMADRNTNLLLGYNETLAETSPDIGIEIHWLVIPDTLNA